MQNICTPFTLNQLERTVEISAAVVQSTPFYDCVVYRVTNFTIPCAPEPFSTSALSTQGVYVVTGLRRGNHVEMGCAYNNWTDETGGSTWGNGTTFGVSLAGQWTLEHWDSMGMAGEPWFDRVGAIVHEYGHWQGYDHVDASCGEPGMCALSECMWTSNCGGVGIPPMGTGPDPARRDHREQCSYLWGQDWDSDGDADDTWYENRFTVKAPMWHAEECAMRMVELSAGCSPCAGSSIPLVTSFSTSTNDFGSTCACVPSQRHAISLLAYNNTHYVNAAPLVTSTAVGMSETFYLMDMNGGSLSNGDTVRIRINSTSTYGAGDLYLSAATAGAAVTTTSSSTSSAGNFTIYRTAGNGVVSNGDTVGFYAQGAGRYLTAASGGGGGLAAGGTLLQQWETFTLTEPRRHQVAHLQTSAFGASRFVTYNSSASLDLTTASPATVYASGGATGTAARRQQAFWILDHNGGSLQHGDVISLEWSAGGGSQFFWQTCTNGTGNVRGNGVHHTGCARFQIFRTGGAGNVTDGTTISLLNVSTGRYLSVNTGTNRITNAATSVGASETFTFGLPQGSRF